MTRAVWALGVAVVAAELAFGPRYGLFRDELYYLACADHLAWGYVDQPPLSIAVLALVRALGGDALLVVRLVPALLGGALVLIVGRIARVLGGGATAQVLAALATALAPVYLGAAGYFSMNSIDLTIWALAELVLARLIVEDDARLWLPLGALLGLGLENKLSVLFLGAGLAVALVVTPLRHKLARKEPWLALAVALALFAPHAIWQAQHDFPTREFIANATRVKNVALSLPGFVLGQVRELGPINVLLWLPGLLWLLARPRFRALGIVFVVAFAILAAQHSKPYYLAPAYPALFAAGGVALERLPRAWMRYAAGALVATGVVTAPFAIPVLPVDRFLAYAAALGQRPVAQENTRLGPLPQHFADRFGWQELAATVAQVYWSLPAEDRARVVIVGDNYGEAGAIDYYGRRYGLPRAVSQHNSYWFWGPGRDRIDVAILIGQDLEDMDGAWREVKPAARVVAPLAMPYETRRPILVARDLLRPLDEAWRRGKMFI
jgi:4-amino-4-deoxy-L-arabinose transferase-like glycosyltransferase